MLINQFSFVLLTHDRVCRCPLPLSCLWQMSFWHHNPIFEQVGPMLIYTTLNTYPFKNKALTRYECPAAAQ